MLKKQKSSVFFTFLQTSRHLCHFSMTLELKMIWLTTETFKFFLTIRTCKSWRWLERNFMTLTRGLLKDWWKIAGSRKQLEVCQLSLNLCLGKSTLIWRLRWTRELLYRKFTESFYLLHDSKLCRVFFLLAAILTATSMIDERATGIWSRAIVAGVTPSQFLISHLIEGVAVMMIQFVELSSYILLFLFPPLTWKATVLLLLILLFLWFGFIFMNILFILITGFNIILVQKTFEIIINALAYLLN